MNPSFITLILAYPLLKFDDMYIKLFAVNPFVLNLIFFFRCFIIIIILKECNLGVGIINCPFSFKSQFSFFCYDEQLFIVT